MIASFPIDVRKSGKDDGSDDKTKDESGELFSW